MGELPLHLPPEFCIERPCVFFPSHLVGLCDKCWDNSPLGGPGSSWFPCDRGDPGPGLCFCSWCQPHTWHQQTSIRGPAGSGDPSRLRSCRRETWDEHTLPSPCLALSFCPCSGLSPSWGPWGHLGGCQQATGMLIITVLGRMTQPSQKGLNVRM